MDIIAFSADEPNLKLTDEDSTCIECTDETEHIIKDLRTGDYAPVCDDHLMEYFEGRDEIPVIEVEDTRPYVGGVGQ